MTQSRYVHSISLTEQEEEMIKQLKLKHITQAEIFRTGLTLCQKAEHKPLKPPAKLIKRAKEICKNV